MQRDQVGMERLVKAFQHLSLGARGFHSCDARYVLNHLGLIGCASIKLYPQPTGYPKAREAKCLSVTLNPGELLIQPAGWFHQVYALDSPNMSVSYYWRYWRRRSFAQKLFCVKWVREEFSFIHPIEPPGRKTRQTAMWKGQQTPTATGRTTR